MFLPSTPSVRVAAPGCPAVTDGPQHARMASCWLLLRQCTLQMSIFITKGKVLWDADKDCIHARPAYGRSKLQDLLTLFLDLMYPDSN